jgi:hypothetical protein
VNSAVHNLTFSLFGADTRGVWSEKSACGERAPRGAGPFGDATGRGSGGRCGSGGERGIDADDS